MLIADVALMSKFAHIPSRLSAAGVAVSTAIGGGREEVPDLFIDASFIGASVAAMGSGWLPNLAVQPAQARGRHYVDWLHQVLPTTELLTLGHSSRDRQRILAWMGRHSEAINLWLNVALLQCRRCLVTGTDPRVSILAAPLATEFGLAGLCMPGSETKPTLIVIDIGRVPPSDWLGLIAHEFAHAWLGRPGHDREFQQVLNHLCLGLGLPECPVDWHTTSRSTAEQALRHWPPATILDDALATWRGDRPLFELAHGNTTAA